MRCASLSRCSAPTPKKRVCSEGTPLRLPAHGLRPRYPCGAGLRLSATRCCPRPKMQGSVGDTAQAARMGLSTGLRMHCARYPCRRMAAAPRCPRLKGAVLLRGLHIVDSAATCAAHRYRAAPPHPPKIRGVRGDTPHAPRAWALRLGSGCTAPPLPLLGLVLAKRNSLLPRPKMQGSAGDTAKAARTGPSTRLRMHCARDPCRDRLRPALLADPPAPSSRRWEF